jgi:hypothetical protein
MEVRICEHCGAKNEQNTWICTNCGMNLSVIDPGDVSNNTSSEDTGWKCKNCGNFNVRTNICSKCGRDKNFVAADDPSVETPVNKQSKADDLYWKGWKCFWDGYIEPDKDRRNGHLTKAQGYLSMSYKEAGNNVEEKKGIAGLMAITLTNMEDYKNAEAWARAELSINPTNVLAKLSMYFIELDKLVGHKGFVAQSDGSGFGIFASLLTTGVDAARVQNKKTTVKTVAIEAAKAIENKARTDPEPNPGAWILWSYIMLSIIDNMWTNNMREPYLCNVLLNLPWHKFSGEEFQELQDAIEEIQVNAQGYLARLK